MKKITLFLLAIITTSTLWAKSYDFKYGDLYYKITSTNTVKVTRKNDKFHYNKLSSISIPSTVTHKKITYNVTRIGWQAFEDCSSLTSITIPNSVTSIGDGAFRGCNSLTSVTIPNSVTSIGSYAFSGCSSLTSITIPNSVTSIDDRAFSGCSSLSSVTIPNSVTSIGKVAFCGCSRLTSVTIPNSVTSIEMGAFWGCSSLTSVTIPNSVTSIGWKAFANCERLKTITYLGNKTQWDDIYKDRDWNCNTNPKISFNTQHTQQYPPLLALVENSLTFIDASNNNRIEANEQNQIRFKVRNRGKGPAINCEAYIRMSGTTSGIHIETVKLPQINPGKEHEVIIPISTDINTQDGNVTFAIEVYEFNGFGIAPFNLTMATKAYVAPYLKVVDYQIASESGMAKRMDFITLKFLLQNLQHGDAENVKVNIQLPKNVSVVEGETELSYASIQAKKSKEILLTLVASNSYAANTIPVTINVKEQYGRFAENKQINIALNQTTSTNITIAATDTIQQTYEAIAENKLTSEVDRNIPQAHVRNNNTFVVILANENYKYVAPVPYALNDGNIFRQYCGQTLGISSENIKMFSNATKNDMIQAISWIESVCHAYEGEASVIFYYAGHGIPDVNNKASYLLPADGDSKYVETAYKLDDIYQTLGAVPAKSITILLDACFSGANRNGQMLASERGVALVARPGVPKGNMVILSAAQGNQTALPNEAEKHGMFTYFLLKKLQETQGNVTLGELSEYVIREVKRKSSVINKTQEPSVNYAPNVADQWRNWRLK